MIYDNLPYQVQYFKVLQKLMTTPKKWGDSRVGEITSSFAEQIRVDLKKEFPIMDIKKIKFENVVHELLWMLRGETNIKYLVDNDCNIWNDDAYRYYKEKYSPYNKKNRFKSITDDISINQSDLGLDIPKEEFIKKVKNGEKVSFVGPQPPYGAPPYITYNYGQMDKIYGYQWRYFNGATDQVKNCINTLKSNPDDRRIIITAHNPTDIENGEVGLPSCHNYIQFYTVRNGNGKYYDGKRYLSTFVNIRSNDWFLGQPYNVVQYALLTHIIANIVGMEVDELVINSVDAHLYKPHFDAAQQWIDRYNEKYESLSDINQDYLDPFEIFGSKAEFRFTREDFTIDDLTIDDFELINYKPKSYIKAPLLT